jgi:putative SOS response-associated peptidase YedK
MCGRYDFFPGEFSDLRIRFNLDRDMPDFKPSYNIAPGKDFPVIISPRRPQRRQTDALGPRAVLAARSGDRKSDDQLSLRDVGPEAQL